MIADPIERDEQVLIDREDEAAREQRWAGFVLAAKQFAVYGWTDVIADVAHAHRAERQNSADQFGPGRFAWHVLQFAADEGWSSTLSAVARAMKESGQ